MLKRRETVVQTHTQWRGRTQMKKIRIVMTVILVMLCISVAAGGILAWVQIRQLSGRKTRVASVSSDTAGEGNAGGLPVYDNSFSLMLVNQSNPLVSGYSPELTKLNGIQVDERILPALKKLMAQAEAAGCPLTLSGGYVTSSEQSSLYQAEVQRLMNQEHLSRVRSESQAQSTVGKGGYNENQTGLAVTFSSGGQSGENFASTKQYHWLSENSVYYGFILRYPENKKSMTGMDFQPDHFRYVGTDNAVKMREFSMCLEEYATYLSKQTQN